MNNKILVTGSSGMIGTRLCELLLKKGYEVNGVDVRRNKWNKKIDKITEIIDLRCVDELQKLIKDTDIIIHLAANARVYDLVVSPDLALDNVIITYNILEHCRKYGIKKIIFSSSREVYGNTSVIFHNENEVSIDNCESPYSASKIACEALIRSYKKCYDIDFILTRFSNVYGMYDESNRLVPLFIRLTKENQDLEIFGKDKLLDFTYIDDTVEGVIKCIDNFDVAKNQVYNIGTGKGTTIIEVAELIRKYMGHKNNVNIKDNRTGEVVKFIADISKARKQLGYSPKVNVDEGIQSSIKWYTEYIDSKMNPLFEEEFNDRWTNYKVRACERILKSEPEESYE